MYSRQSIGILSSLHQKRLTQPIQKLEKTQSKPFEIEQMNKENCESQEDGSQEIFSGLIIPISEDQQKKAGLLLDIPSAKMINYDLQLKRYISTKRHFKPMIFNDKMAQFTKFSETPRITKHKRQKSKSQMMHDKKVHRMKSQPTNRSEAFSQCGGFFKQNQLQNSEILKKSRTNKKNVKFFEPTRQTVKPVSLKSLEMQLIVRKTNEKRQTMINEIIKKLHLPQVNPRISNSLRMLVSSYHAEKEFVTCERKSVKIIGVKSKKPIIQRSVEARISAKFQEVNKSIEMRKGQKEIFLSKIKFTQLKDVEGTTKSNHLGAESQKIDYSKLFA